MNTRKLFAALVSLASIASAAEAAPTTYTFNTLMSDRQGATGSFTGSYTIDPVVDNPNTEYAIFDVYSGQNSSHVTAFSLSGSITNVNGTESINWGLANLDILSFHLDNGGNITSVALGANAPGPLPYTGYTAFGIQDTGNGALQAYVDSETNYLTGPFVAVASPAAPVPEPGVWAMMVGGLGLVGGAARRRRRKALVTA